MHTLHNGNGSCSLGNPAGEQEQAVVYVQLENLLGELKRGSWIRSAARYTL